MDKDENGKARKTAWVVDYKDVTGKRRLKTFRLKKDADNFAATATMEVREGTHVADSATVTVKKAAEMWMTSAKNDGLEQSTIEDYERLLKLHILPFLGAVKLTAINKARVRTFEDELRAGGRSDSMTKRVLSSLSTLLAFAQGRDLLVRNAVQEVKRADKGRKNRVAARQKDKLMIGVDIPTRAEIDALIAVLDGRWRPLILTAIFTGLRASELRGCRWEDVDFAAGQIHVRQRADRYNSIGKPKSATSGRKIPVPPPVLQVLREWKVACPRNAAKKLELVFPNMDGKVLQLKMILRFGLHPAWVKAGVTFDTGQMDDKGRPVLAPKYTGLHCLRHWFASWCLNRKADGGRELPIKMVQEWLGHSTIALTNDVYSHLFPSADGGSELSEAVAGFKF